jgi:hypothetical protein
MLNHHVLKEIVQMLEMRKSIHWISDLLEEAFGEYFQENSPCPKCLAKAINRQRSRAVAEHLDAALIDWLDILVQHHGGMPPNLQELLVTELWQIAMDEDDAKRRSAAIVEALMRKGRMRQQRVRFKQGLSSSRLNFGEDQLPVVNTNIEPSDSPPVFLGSVPKKKRKGQMRQAVLP